MHRNLKKISITVNPSLLDDIDYVVGRLGVSRSAFISEMLSEAVTPVRRLLEQVPINPEASDVLRFRGESVELVRSRIESVKGAEDDLFSE